MSYRRSQVVRSRDVAALMELSHEAALLPPDPVARRRHVLSGLCGLVGARAGCAAYFPFGAPDALPPDRPDVPVVLAGFDATEEEGVHGYLANPSAFPKDPTIDHLERLPGAYCTNLRDEFVDDRAWYRSDFFNVVRKGLDVDSQIYARVPAPGGRMMTLALCRGVGERGFGRRETTLFDLFNRTLGRVYTAPPAPGDGLRRSLPPRLRRVLDRLLAGDSEKEAAKCLGLSVHSVHQYTKMLYKRLAVCSRAELMARFIKPAAADDASRNAPPPAAGSTHATPSSA